MRTLLSLIILLIFLSNTFSRTPGTKKWKYEYYGGITASPAIGNDGTVYIAVDSTVIHAINPDGTKKWDFETYSHEAFFTPPVIDMDGTIYVISDKLYAINPDSTLKWEFPTGGDGIALGSNGTIYTSYNDWSSGKIYAVNSDGTLNWIYESENNVSSPAIGADGTLYFASSKKLIALNPDKTEKWIFKSNSNILSAPVIGFEGIIYVQSEGALLAVNPIGKKKWESQTDYAINSSFAIANDGTIYGTTDGYMLWAINPDGSNKWLFQIDSSYSDHYSSSTPAIDSEGTIYIGLGDTFYAINPDGSKKWDFTISGQISQQSSPAIASDGTVYFDSWDGFYAVNTGSSGLADSPWSKFRGNNQNIASQYNENCPIAQVVEDHFALKNGGQITLDASPSYDPDGDALSYLWRIVEKPSGSSLTLSDSTSETITVEIPGGQFAEYCFALKVTDNQDGASWLPLLVNSGKKWEFDGGGSRSLALSNDGTIYTISDKLYAINDDGTKKWEYDIRGGHVSVGNDETIYVSTWDYEFYAFNPNGTIKWKYVAESNPGPPAIGVDGSIYFTTYEKLLALNTDGSNKWDFKIGNDLSPPVVGAEGTLYLYTNGKFIALNPDGTRKWESDLDYYSYSSPAIGVDGTIYCTSQNAVYAIRPDGTRKWVTHTTYNNTFSSLTIGSDGTIYRGSDKLYALNPDGTVKWEFKSGGVIRSTPAVGSDGTIYFGSADSTFYAINPDGTEKWAFKAGSGISSSPALDNDGIVYFGANGKLYALYTESRGLADSPWPKYNKNNQNTASSYNEKCPQASVAEDFISAQGDEQVTLDGSPSYGPYSERLYYLWRIIEKPQGSSLLLIDSTSAIINVQIPADEKATYKFSLTVTDNENGYSVDQVIVSTVLKWEFDLGSFNSEVSSTAIADDGTIYVGVENKLYAVNSDGTENWTFSTNDEAYYTRAPAIAPDGTIYFAVNNKLYAITQDGLLKWDFVSDGDVSASPAIDINGTIYITAQEYGIWYGGTSTLSAINPDGAIKWIINTGYMYTSATPVIGPNGTIYVLSSGGNYDIYWNLLEAISSDGVKQWSAQVGVGFPAQLPAIDVDGTIYVGSDTLFAVNPNGTKKWEFDANGQFISSPVIGTDGIIFAISNDSTFYAINPDGTEKWTFETMGTYEYYRQSAPAIGSDGTVFFTGGNYESNGKFYALNSEGTIKWKLPIYNTSSSPAIDPDGTVYLGSNDGKLIAIYSDCGGLADSPWPKFNRDNRNSANGFNPNCPVARVVDEFISVKDGGDVALDGSPSYDPDGDALSYLWRIIEKPQGSNFTLTDSTSAIVNIKIPVGSRESYRFSLIVTDNDDGTSWASVTVSSEMKWVFNTNEGVGSPAINVDGSIYFNSGSKLFAANPDGTKKWEFETNAFFGINPPLIASDGTIYVGNYGWGVNLKLYAITPEGSMKWVYSDIQGNAPAIDADGIIYIGWDSKLRAINPDSTLKWEFDLETVSSISTPVIGSDGMVYMKSRNKLYALDSTGIKQWEYEAPDNISYSPIVSSDGTIYISSQQKLIAVNSTGTKKWESEYGYYNPVIGKDYTIYLGGLNSIVALNPDDGSLKWKYLIGSGIYYPAIGNDGTIFFGSGNNFGSGSIENSGCFFAVNPDGTLKWKFMTKSSDISAPAIDPFGTIYFGSGTQLYALYSDCGGLADSPWPKYMHDNCNTGYVNTPTPIEKNSKSQIPKEFSLSQNFPNPFNPVTTISYQLPVNSRVELGIYNILGQKVVMLVNKKQEAGTHKVEFNAGDLASGVYIYKIKAGSFEQSRKMVLLQ